MLRKKGYEGYKPTPHHLVTPTGKNVERLLELGVFDAQGLSSGDSRRLLTKAGLTEIELARSEAERIEAETGVKPQLYGRQIVEIVKAAKTDPESPETVEEKRERLYATLADQALKAAE